MAFGVLLPLRIAQGLFAVVVLGLSGYVVHWYDADTLTASPSQFNFLIFLSLFALVSVAYQDLAPRFVQKASHPYAHFGVEVLNSLFYFAGFVALATFLSKLLFCRGTVCSAARADVVFAAFSWLLWTATSVLLGIELFKGGFRSFRGVKTDARAAAAMKEATPPATAVV